MAIYRNIIEDKEGDQANVDNNNNLLVSDNLSQQKLDITNLHLTNIKDNQINLTQKTKIYDSFGNSLDATLMDELMIAEKNRVAGGVFNGTNPDTNFYTTTLNANGTANISNYILTLATTTDSDSSSMIITNTKARYIGGNMNSLRFVGRVGIDNPTNNTIMTGLTEDSTLANSIYFRIIGNELSIVAKTQGLSDIIINNGEFNGDVSNYELTGNYSTWEIYYTNKIIKFYINSILIHTLTETTLPICGTRHLRAFAKNINTGVGSISKLELQVMSILTHGKNKTQAKYYFQQNTTTGVLLKTGIGSIHMINISGVVNNAVVTLYDGTSTSGTLIYSTGAMTNQTVPLNVPFNDGIIFQNGLFLTITGANCNAMVIYE